MVTDDEDNEDNEDSDGDEAGEGKTPREIARRQRRVAGDRSARAAHALMELPAALLDDLGLADELREAVEQARAVTSHVARRRAERRLAGELRRVDADDLERRLAEVEESGRPDVRRFQLAETWRRRLIEEGASAVEAFFAAFAGADRAELTTLIEAARRERATGRPRGAARALFRHVMVVLREGDRTSAVP